MDESGNAMVLTQFPFTHHEVGPAANATTSIKVNQQGYLPFAPKTAYIGACVRVCASTTWRQGIVVVCVCARTVSCLVRR